MQKTGRKQVPRFQIIVSGSKLKVLTLWRALRNDGIARRRAGLSSLFLSVFQVPLQVSFLLRRLISNHQLAVCQAHLIDYYIWGNSLFLDRAS